MINAIILILGLICGLYVNSLIYGGETEATVVDANESQPQHKTEKQLLREIASLQNDCDLKKQQAFAAQEIPAVSEDITPYDDEPQTMTAEEADNLESDFDEEDFEE